MKATVTQCAVLVGGLGTRLGTLTATTPKPILPCGGRPFLFWLLREFVRFGVTDFLLLTGHLSVEIERAAADIQASLPRPANITLSEEPAPARATSSRRRGRRAGGSSRGRPFPYRLRECRSAAPARRPRKRRPLRGAHRSTRSAPRVGWRR